MARTRIQDPSTDARTQNGGFINPPIEKRNNRDPYGEWWDKQDKRNYGEPVHEDNDILGALSLHDYDHFTPGWAGVLLGCFGVAVVGLCGVTAFMYPDKKSVPKCYPDGLEAELGGPRAVRVRGPRYRRKMILRETDCRRHGKRVMLSTGRTTSLWIRSRRRASETLCTYISDIFRNFTASWLYLFTDSNFEKRKRRNQEIATIFSVSNTDKSPNLQADTESCRFIMPKASSDTCKRKPGHGLRYV